MKIRVFKNQYGFSTLAKNGDEKMYIQVQFKRGIEPSEEKVDIILNNAFFSMYKNKQGLAFPKLVVLDYEIETNELAGEENATISQDELPF